jgi:hypothetical protein
MIILNNRFRIIALTLVGIVFLIVYGYIFNPTITLVMCLENPARYDAKVIEIGTEATVADLISNGFVLRQFGMEIPVYGQVRDLAINDFVSLKAVFHREGYLELLKVHAAKGRRLKIWISVPPLFFVIGFFFYKYKFNLRQFLFLERC